MVAEKTLKFVKLEILSTSFIHFLYDELGELRSRSLGLKFVKLEILSTSFIDFLYDELGELRLRSFFSLVVAYQLCLKMGDVLGEGTEGNVFIQLFGEVGMTEKIQLRQAGNSKIRFEKGRTYKFTVETVDIGKVSILNLMQKGTC